MLTVAVFLIIEKLKHPESPLQMNIYKLYYILNNGILPSNLIRITADI